MIFQALLLLFFFFFEKGTALRFDEGCTAKSEWKIDYKWNEIQISAWVPPEESATLLEIEVEIEGYIHPVYYDSIELRRNEIMFERIRDGIRYPVKNQMPFVISEGWADFVLTLDSHYGLRYLPNDSALPLNVSAEYLPTEIHIKGSNVTLNCQSDTRVWKVAKGNSSIPLDGSDQYLFTFYSTKTFSPTIILEMREFPLRWENTALTTIPSKTGDLPPFVEHQVMLICSNDAETMCTIKVGKDRKVAEVIRLASKPNSVAIRNNQDNSFLVFLHKNEPLFPQTPVPLELKKSLETSGGTFLPFVLGVLVAISFIVVIIAAVYKRHRTRHNTLAGVERTVP